MTDAGRRLMPGLTGDLVSASYIAHRLFVDFDAEHGADTRDAARRTYRAWWRRHGHRLGPASSARTIRRDGAGPVFDLLGIRLGHTERGVAGTLLEASAGAARFPVVLTTWGGDLDRWFVRAAARADTAACPWVMGFDGRSVRLRDVRRGWARAYVAFDLETLADADGLFAAFWALLRAQALESTTARMAAASREHGHAVCVSLRDGVRDALALLVAALGAPGRSGAARDWKAHADAAFEQALTIVYRVLFLLFAESRGLLPTWHRTYRQAYSIETLRTRAERPGRHPGLWASLQAAARLAHAGCHAGDLVVTPFNGRLFAPDCAPLADRAHLDDELVAKAIVCMTTTDGAGCRERIAFGDLDVEQLGAVYERVLDYEPVRTTATVAGDSQRSSRREAAVGLVSTGIARKSSGTFYTPRDMTDYLVARTLDPLTAGRSSQELLELRVLDPAMGSGAFLVGACRHLASAYERALVRESGRLPGDITDAERAEYRRVIAQRCLYGVDVNPTAVQVARLSLWLATLEADKPLTFLDHRLAVGNSLVGADLQDLSRWPRRIGARTIRHDLPLFAEHEAVAAVLRTLPGRTALAEERDDDVVTVRHKEKLLAGLREDVAGLARFRRQADLWCARWFWDAAAGPRPESAVFEDLARSAGGYEAALPARLAAPLQGHAERIAAAGRFFHWSLEFPEVFFDADGRRRRDAGFDAVVTNPPWDMARGDLGDERHRVESRAWASRLVSFVRESGVYAGAADGHVNLYQLFVARCLSLTRRGGRLGIIAPWGLLSDRGSRHLRETLFDTCAVDTVVGFDNADGVFPVHRGVRFALVCASRGRRTGRMACRFGLRDVAELVSPAATRGTRRGTVGERIELTPARLERLSGASKAVPYVRRARDLRILESIAARHPPLGRAGWGLEFGRELNASDDKPLMAGGRRTGLIVVEGKDLSPFVLRTRPDTLRVPDDRLPSKRSLGRQVRGWRLACREVTGVSNRHAIIAALVPPGHVCVHSVLCLRSAVPLATQAYLCAVMNSAVANFVAKAWVTTHIGGGFLDRLPVPRRHECDPAFVDAAQLALALRESGAGDEPRMARLQAHVARLYGLARQEYVWILETFPRAAGAAIQACLDTWDDTAR